MYNTDVIFSSIENMEIGDLIGRCLRIVADSERPEQFFTSAKVLTHWRILSQTLPEPTDPERFSRLIARICLNL